MNFAHFAGFQALSFMDRTVPKKIVIFVGEMVTGRFAYKSFRLQVDSPVHRGRFAYTTKIVSPTRSELIRLH